MTDATIQERMWREPGPGPTGNAGPGVVHDPELDMWIVSRYETVRSVFRDPATFSSMVVLDPIAPLCPEAVQVLQSGQVWIPPLLANNDPPDHQIHRRFLGGPFRRGRIARRQPMVAAVVAEAVDRLGGLDGSTDDGPVDLIRELTWPVPVQVLFTFLGVPDPDVAMVKRWTASRVELIGGRPGPEQQVEAARNLVAFMDYARRFVADKARSPGDDYTSELLRDAVHEDRDQAQIRYEISVNLFNLMAAGHETTTHLLTNTIRRLLSMPGAWSALAADPSSAPELVEEALRCEPSVKAWRRRTTVDTELEGVAIPAGSIVLLRLIDANRDPSHFPEPERFDPARPRAADHLSFGFGAHHCLGAPLARMELAETLARLPAAFPRMELADRPPEWQPNLLLRASDRLDVWLAGAPAVGGGTGSPSEG